MTGLQQVQKALFDYLFAIVLIVFSTPLMVLIAIAIKLGDRGPIFFRQKRQGLNHEVFNVIKFRTMSVLEIDERPVNGAAEKQHVTQIGSFLRRTGFDELPQLVNIMKGEMSLIGPRPHAIAHNREFHSSINQYARRHTVKPGITGWAQVNGSRGRADTLEKMKSRLEYDLYYINNWSIGFELRIFFMTLIVIFRSILAPDGNID